MTRSIQTTAILAALAFFLCPSAKSATLPTFQIYENAAGGPNCGAVVAGTPVSFTNLTCNGPDNSTIVGSAISTYRKLGAAISGFSSLQHGGSTVGVNMEQIFSQNELSPLQSGDQISFFYEANGLVSIGADGRVGLSIVSDVNGNRVLSDQFYINPPPPGLYGQVFQTAYLPVDPSGKYDVYLGFNDSMLGTASSDFLGTLYLQEIAVTTSDGTPVNGVTFTLGNGDVLPANQVLPSPDAVPEPGTYVLLFSGLSLVLLKGTRKSWYSPAG